MRVCVLTPSLPGRERLLDECRASVAAQTFRCEHLVGVDEGREGPSVIRNRLAASTNADWLLPLDDDDLIREDCVERLLDASEGADIVYPWARMDGRTDGWCPNKLYNAATLHKQNFITVTALIRRDLWMMLGGQRKTAMEDWDFYRRAELHDARFVCVPEELFVYRFGVNSFQAEVAA